MTKYIILLVVIAVLTITVLIGKKNGKGPVTSVVDLIVKISDIISDFLDPHSRRR